MNNSENQIKVSIIVPVFNVEPFLEKALISAAHQTFDSYSYEVIIINDGSTDNSIKLIEDYTKRHQNFFAYSQENSGLSMARNAGLKRARGDFVVFLDSDDFLQPDFLEKMYNACIENDAQICYCANYIYVNNRRFRFYMPLTGKNAVLDKKTALKRLIRDNTLHYFAWNKMYKRSIFTDNNIDFPDMYFEDIATTPRTFFYADRVAVLSKAVYNYTRRKGSILTTMNIKKINDYIKAFGIIRNFLEKNVDFSEYKASFKYILIRSMICNYANLFKIHILAKNFKGFWQNIKRATYSARYYAGDDFKITDGVEIELLKPILVPEKKEKRPSRKETKVENR